MPEPCGNRLTGHYRDRVMVCELDAGHHGAHEAPAPGAYSSTLHWTANALWLQAVAS